MSEQLSPLMRQTLRALVLKPGRFPNTYPGGARTIRALTARGLAETHPIVTAGVKADCVFATHKARITLAELDGAQ